MELVLVRHGIAMDRDDAIERAIGDRDRPLTNKGRARAGRVAKGLSRLFPGVRAILSSPLLRAVETADILSGAYGDLEREKTPALLPEADPNELAEVISERTEQSPIIAVGHEPHLSGFVTWCLFGPREPVVELKKCGACLLRFDELPGQSKGRLIWLAPPAILRHI